MKLKQRIQAKETRLGKLLMIISIVAELLVESLAELTAITSLFGVGEGVETFIPEWLRNAIRLLALIGIIAGKLTAEKKIEVGEQPERAKQ
jgi:hypothetical protein